MTQLTGEIYLSPCGDVGGNPHTNPVGEWDVNGDSTPTTTLKLQRATLQNCLVTPSLGITAFRENLLVLCCIRSQSLSEKEDSLYSSHKSSKKSSSKPKQLSDKNKRSAHISFNNPYYDVIAAMDLAGDIDQDFHNPLFIQQ